MAKTKPCMECEARPKEPGRHRCLTCRLRHEPIDVQVAASRYRLGLVPATLRVKRVHPSLWPAGQRWCASCQSFRDLEDMKGGSQCRACKSAVTHSARIAKLYNLTAADYASLLAAQGGKCAICRRDPKTKRLAVDHDHKTNAVRGLLCSRCNHDLMGAAWDSLAMAKALLSYLEAPPATGNWTPPETVIAVPRGQHGLVAPGGALAVPTPKPNALDSLPPLEVVRRMSAAEAMQVMHELHVKAGPAPF